MRKTVFTNEEEFEKDQNAKLKAFQKIQDELKAYNLLTMDNFLVVYDTFIELVDSIDGEFNIENYDLGAKMYLEKLKEVGFIEI